MPLQSGSYSFKPHEMPIMAGTPASPDHPPRRRLAYLVIGTLLSLVSGFQNGVLSAVLPQLRGDLALDLQQGGWIQAAYFMSYACMSVLFFKIRQAYGVQRFVRITLFTLLAANLSQQLHHSYEVELFARVAAGIAASGLLVLSMYYLMQAFPGEKKLAGLVLGLGMMQVGTPLAQSFVPQLYGDGLLDGVFALQSALSLACIAAVLALPLPPGYHERGAFTLSDALSFTLFASGIALLCAFLVQGRIVWWTTAWLGWLLVSGIGLSGLALCLEVRRQRPMLDWHWMTVPQMLIFAVMGAMARLLTSEQTVGAAGLMTILGVGSSAMSTFYLIMAGASLLGVIASLVLLDVNDIRKSVMLALACFALGAWLEIGVGMQTRPAQLYFSQSIVAFATLLFMGPMLLEGLVRALAKSPDHIMSFSAVFGLSQTLGGLAGAAVFSAFLTYRTRDHLTDIAQNLTLSNPALAADIQRNAAALAPSLADPVLLQGSAVSQITVQAAKEAAIVAYSDLFALLTAMASVATLTAFALWAYRRYHRIDILAKEKAVVFAMLGK